MSIIEVPVIVKGYEGEYPMSKTETAKYLDISLSTLNNYVVKGTGPIGYKIGGHATAPVVYFERDLIRWQEEIEAHNDNRLGKNRAKEYGYVSPRGVNTRRYTG